MCRPFPQTQVETAVHRYPRSDQALESDPRRPPLEAMFLSREMVSKWRRWAITGAPAKVRPALPPQWSECRWVLTTAKTRRPNPSTT